MAVKGTILGDILGSPYEKHKPRDYETVPLLGQDLRFTDDTVTTLAVKKAILEGSDLTQTMAELCLQHIECGFGGKFFNWIIDDSHKPYGSWGNGSAMRVSPVGWAFDTLEETLVAAKQSAEVTHNHPEGIKGAQATAACIFWARKGKTKQQIKEYVEALFGYDLSRTCDEIRPTYEFEPSCQKTVPESIIAFLESTDYESAVRLAVSLGGDADTMGSITGGIAEAFYGGVPQHI